MLFVILIGALIPASILPDIVAFAVHDPILKVALKVPAIGPPEAPLARHFIIEPGAFIATPIGPEVATRALLDPVLEVTVIVASIAPHLDALPVLLILNSSELTLCIQLLQVLLDLVAQVLSKDTQICLPITLPIATVNFI